MIRTHAKSSKRSSRKLADRPSAITLLHMNCLPWLPLVLLMRRTDALPWGMFVPIKCLISRNTRNCLNRTLL